MEWIKKYLLQVLVILFFVFFLIFSRSRT